MPEQHHHRWTFVDVEDDLFRIFKCDECRVTAYERIREYGLLPRPTTDK